MKICLYCGQDIEMKDYRGYTIVQHEDETAITVYLHLHCLEQDEDHWMIKTLESRKRLGDEKE